jgi:hypothetical protein
MSVLCARCEIHYYTPYGEDRGPDDPFPPALSRLSRGEAGTQIAGSNFLPIYVCSECGQDEAMLEYTGQHLPTPDEWPVEIQFNLLERRWEP